MRYFLALIAVICVIVCVPSAKAGAKQDSVAFQGSLTDASNTPVSDGPRDLTISIWTDSIGGTMLHSEVVVVTTSKGLFSTCVGCGSDPFPDIFTGQTLFLETQLAGQPPMAPRTRLRNSPQAMMAVRVRGDISTNPGFVIVGDSAAGGSVRVKAGLENAGGVVAQGASLRITGDPDFDLLRLSADPDSAKIRISGQSTGDPDFDLLRIQGGVGTTSQGASVTITGDPDFDLLRLSADADSAKIRISAQSAGDPDFDLLRITGGSGNAHVSLHSAPSTAVGVANTWKDDDCDGISARSVLGGMSGSTTGTIRMVAEPGATSSTSETDDDGDGNSESKVGTVLSGTFNGGPGNVILQLVDIDDDGTPDNSIQSSVTPTTSSVAIKVKGTGADANRTASSACDDSSAVDYLDLDDDGDGISEAKAVSSVSSLGGGGGGAAAASYAATGRWYTDSDDDGIPEGDISQSVTPTTCSVAIKTKGTGADANRTALVTTTTGLGDISTVSTIDDDGDGVSDLSIEQAVTSSAVVVLYGSKKGYDYYQMQGQHRASLVMRDSTKDTTFFVDGDGRIGIGKPADAVKRIDVAGGAYCDGTTWVNASDANAKENFRPVDGAELLQKLDELEITRWNYKGDTETEHIGPTAQDFRGAFGVGSDGKSISTIDPSGIALAAIKELNSKLNTQNQTLSEENKQLRKEMDELKKLVQKLASRK